MYLPHVTSNKAWIDLLFTMKYEQATNSLKQVANLCFYSEL